MADNQRVITSYKEVSEELGKKLIKLYSEKIFPRQGKVFADKLFATGVEAGAYIASLADIYDRGIKMDLANHAMVKLNTVSYLIYIMREAGYYTQANVMEMQEFLAGLINAMRDLLNNANAGGRPDSSRRITPSGVPFRPTTSPQATVISAPSPAVQAEAAPADSLSEPEVKKPEQPKVNHDPDGFNAPAE